MLQKSKKRGHRRDTARNCLARTPGLTTEHLSAQRSSLAVRSNRRPHVPFLPYVVLPLLLPFLGRFVGCELDWEQLRLNALKA
jgi:hypothetical protein